MVETKKIVMKNDCYKTAAKMVECRGVMIHSTATPGVYAERFAKSWNEGRPNGKQVCVHAFIDDKNVVNILPYDMRCWGCGYGAKGSGNDFYIQVELCEDKNVYYDKAWNYKTKDEEETKEYIGKEIKLLVEWAASRLVELGFSGVDKDNVTSHYEAYKMGMASNHGDPQGYLGLAGITMDNVRDMINEHIKRLMDENKIAHDGKEPSRGKLIKVLVGELNIRSGAGTAFRVVGCIRDKGVYTIVETQGSWGKLKSGAGWIHLGYTKEVG